MHLLGTRVAQHAENGTHRRPTHYGVVHNDDALAADVVHDGRELLLDAQAPQPLVAARVVGLGECCGAQWRSTA